jgi:Na+-translocating ferredoxin:NAD+ oxidoreductase RnfG subunit
MAKVEWLAALPALAPIVCYSAQYLSVEQARKAIFPDATDFKELKVVLSDDQKTKIEKRSNTNVRERALRIFEAFSGRREIGKIYVDDVYGKHEFITYAVGVTTKGSVRSVEIMTYRETRGDEIRRPEWRKQFEGKTAKDALKLDQDVMNISGATLSSKHVTEGVRKILATDAVLRDL